VNGLPRILIFGRIGQVGYELRRTLAALGPVTCVDYPEVNLTDPHSVRRWITDSKPLIIVNAAAYTAVDKAETEFDLAHKINGIAPAIMAEEAKKTGALLVHYSTDYVYDGAKTSPYTENDATGPLGAYGRSKLAGDQAILAADGNHLIFRLCWVYGGRGNNFLLTMMRLAREREILRVVADQFGSPTWSRMIAEATALALKQVIDEHDFHAKRGVYHLCASGQTSWHGFAKSIVDSLPAAQRKCRKVEAIATADYPTPAKRPAYSVMCCDKFERTFSLRLPSWESSLGEVIEELHLETAK
jgi:dTDP-4-dehydrorhamnose reductase